MARLEKPQFAKALHQREIVEGVVTDKGPTVSLFHPKLPSGKYQKKALWKKNKWVYYVKGNDGPIEFSTEGSARGAPKH